MTSKPTPEAHIPRLAVTAADPLRLYVRFHAGALYSESLVSLLGFEEALASIHEPLLSWEELRHSLARNLDRLYGDVSALPHLLRDSQRAYPLHVVPREPVRAWEEALEAMDRGEELALVLRTVMREHPEDAPFMELLDVLEGGWEALSGLCSLCGLYPISEMGKEGRISELEVEIGGSLYIPRLEALERLFRSRSRP